MPSTMEDQTLWKKVLSEVQLEVSPAVYNTMFKQTRLADIAGGVVTIACTSPVIARLIETRYYALLKQSLDRNVGENTSVLFTVDAALKRGNGKKDIEDLGPLFDTKPQSVALKKYGLRADYLFENFAVSTSNQLAFAAATHVAKNPGDSYNPLFFYGGVGVGKTHLMQAIAHAVLHRDPTKKLVLCAGEEFTNEIIEAIRTKSTPSFRSKFRRAELLCIDDIQFIAGKDSVQEEFFHTFNAVMRDGGQIVLTSDKPPSEIPKLEARIRSRLESGLNVDISPPDFELRTAILLIKAKAKNIDLPIAMAKLIATTITDTRGLEGLLARIRSETNMEEARLSEELITRLLGKRNNGDSVHTSLGNTHLPAKDDFIDCVCTYFQIKSTLLKGKKRDRSIVMPRQILMYLLRTELDIPLTEIGDLIGGRDHTTIMHGIEKISKLITNNEKIRGDVLGIKKLIYG